MAGQSVLQLSRAAIADWRAGDEVVVAPSGYDPTQSEVRTIANINGGTMTSVRINNVQPFSLV